MSDDASSMVTALLIGMGLGVVIGVVITCAWRDADKFCPDCGHQYKAEAKYCSYDGSELRMIGEEE